MHVARKAETEYEHHNHNNLFCNYVMKSGIVMDYSEGLSTKNDLAAQAAQWAHLIDMQEQWQKC